MSHNPASINHRPLQDGEGAERAARRAKFVTEATNASTGDAGVEQGDRAKKAVEDDQGK